MKHQIIKIYFLLSIFIIIGCSNDNSINGTVWIQKVKKDCHTKNFGSKNKFTLRKLEFDNSKKLLIDDSIIIKLKNINDTLMFFTKFVDYMNIYDTIYLNVKNDTTLEWHSAYNADIIFFKNTNNAPENFSVFFERFLADTTFQFQRINIPVLTIELDRNDNIRNEKYDCRRIYFVRYDDLIITHDSISESKINVIFKLNTVKSSNEKHPFIEFILIHNKWYLSKRYFYQ